MNEHAKTPGLITWSGYIAIALLLLLPLSVLTVRSGAWQPGLLLYALASLGSTAVLILFIALLLLPRCAPWRGAIRTRALAALPGAVALLALTLTGGDYPRIHDITTDTADPPHFVAAPQHRGGGANPLDIRPDVIAAQEAAYPDIGSLHTDLDPAQAYERALRTARELGWSVYHEDASAGIIEAADTTPIMAFTDDVVIRVRGDAQGARVDLRSVSRVGEGDIGANAQRIRAFLDAFEHAGGA